MHIYTIESGSASLVGATPKTLVQLVTGSTRRSKIIEVGCSFTSVTAANASGLVELRASSTAGTSSAFTPVPIDPADPVAIQTARNAFTVEPTDVGPIYPGPWNVTPVGGLFVYSWSVGVDLMVPISTRYGLRFTFPDNQSGVRAYITYQE